MNPNPGTETTPTDLDALIESICQYLEENRIQFSGKQLNDAGELYERYDYSTARMVVEGKEGKDERHAAALVHILSLVHKAKLSPDKGAYLIRHLNQVCTHRRKT